MSSCPLGTVAIVGVGLIGGSIGMTLRRRRLAERVVGVGRHPDRLAAAQRCGAIDEGLLELPPAVADAEVVVVCTPVTRIARDILNVSRNAADDVLITDAGSTKRGIVVEVETNDRARGQYVPAHPLAGSEQKGVDHAVAGLFDDRICVLTPTSKTPSERLERARAFWSTLGCRLVEMDPTSHDDALARTSHLPHVVAAALAAITPEPLLPLAAGAYRDCTRVAMSDSSLWAGIFLANRRHVLDALESFRGQLATFEQALRAEDEVALRAWWDAARVLRSAYSEGLRGSESRNGSRS